MSIPSLAIAVSLLTATPTPPEPGIAIDLGLGAPVEHLAGVDEFTKLLAERLVWTMEPYDGAISPASTVRFTAVRIDRGRVSASYQSDARPARAGRSSIAETIGAAQFIAFPDVCFTPEDPPARVRALSGAARLDAAAMERLVAEVAGSGELGRSLGLDRPMKLEWGRHVVLILSAATSDRSDMVRPLVLVLERI